ncbi:MAG: hypothetical protein ACKVOP_02510 [Sphingomonadaceae bacterium]
MNRGSQVVGLWPEREEPGPLEAPVEDAGVSEAAVMDPQEDEEAPPADWAKRFATLICALAAIAWIALICWIYAPRWLATPPTVDAIAAALAVASPPLAVIVLVYMLLTRNSRSRAREMTAASSGLRSEQARLDAALGHVSARLAHEHAELSHTSDQLMTLGEEAAHRLKVTTQGMREEIETLTRYGQSLKFSATSARADMAVLLSDLPKAQVETRQMVAALQEAGLTAHERAGALDALLASLTARGREADEIAGGAAHKLAAHLTRVESVSETSGARLEDAAQRMTGAIDATLARAAEANEAARTAIDAQATALTALVDQTQVALARVGADSAEAIAARIDDVSGKLKAFGSLLTTEAEHTGDLLRTVRDGFVEAEEHLAKIDQSGTARTRELGEAFAALDTHATALTTRLERGTETADTLIARSETLMTALDASAREIDETLPAAFARLDTKVAETAPAITKLQGDATAALDRLIEAEALVAKQRAALDGLSDDATARLAASTEAATQLVAAVREADATTRELAQGAGAQLVEALVRVRETSQSAADKARDAIAAVIPQAVGHLSEATREALARAISEEVSKHIAELGHTAERAVATAHDASDRLMRQMLTIAETSAAVEARIAEARAEVEANDRDNFARRVALLVESLNSTAIDVAKILSNDVTDSAWAAYLRGDRGVFTRRAVRLLDAGEAREVLRHYDNEPDFREQVNRYIHDFEAMLRNVLATRDGSPLGVTLLSSDMGKLYVALAQAIERLRS